jgi:1,4-dihydroxy-2-naphthoate octaprenyltransferase
VAVGTAAAAVNAPVIWWRVFAVGVVAVFLQAGANYANDYSDGVRGVDHERRGPVRLTASGIATPAAVRTAAMVTFVVAMAAGLALAVAVDLRLLVLGGLCILGAWFYSGGRRPYGHSGWGEVAVFAFFGFAATVGSAYVQARSVPAAAWWGSLVVGLPTCAVLVANNFRDIETDRRAGKRTLAVLMGPGPTRRLFLALLVGGMAAVVPIGLQHPTAFIALAAVPLAVGPVRDLSRSANASAHTRSLLRTVRLTFVTAALLSLGLALA